MRTKTGRGSAVLEDLLETCRDMAALSIASAGKIDKELDEYGHRESAAYDRALKFISKGAEIGAALARIRSTRVTVNRKEIQPAASVIAMPGPSNGQNFRPDSGGSNGAA